MKLLKLLAILSLTIALAIPLTSCDNDDNDSPTPPSTTENPGDTPTEPDKPVDNRPEWQKLKCSNEPVEFNGKTMYNHFPDLSNKSSWWPEFDEYWWNTDAQSVLHIWGSSIFHSSGTITRIKLDIDRDRGFFWDTESVEEIVLPSSTDSEILFSTVASLMDMDCNIIIPNKLTVNQPLQFDPKTLGYFPDSFMITDKTGQYHPTEEIHCENTGGNIYFKEYDSTNGVITLYLENFSLSGVYHNGKTHEDEPRTYTINGDISLIYYEYKK